MLGYITEPGNTGGLEGDGRIKATGNRTMNDSLLMFVQQSDYLLLRSDCSIQPHDCPI